MITSREECQAGISQCRPRTVARNPFTRATSQKISWLLISLFILFAASDVRLPAQVVRPLPVPGRIEAEDYDTNGAGISYYDSTSGNSGNIYRNDDVDVEATTDAGGGFDVGWIASGEWICYTVNVQATAVYQFGFRVASANGPGNLQVALDGVPLCSASTPLTGGWQNWTTVLVSNLVLTAGTHLLRLDFPVGGFNLNYVQVTRQKDLTGGFLRVSGKQIVGGQGTNVLLRGMGLGNWMLQEPYMMDASSVAATQTELQQKIAELVGIGNRDRFYTAWLTNYMLAADVAELAKDGFNSIRLPLHYNLFTLPIEAEPVPGQNTWLTNGFELVDNLLSWCESNHLYLILDMHACPGAQGHDRAIADYNPPLPSLWENSTNRAKLVALWGQLATRYANRTWIGGYDLINEPNWTFETNANINGCNDQLNILLRQTFIDITAAIRQVDTNHIIFLEGNCWAGNYNGLLPPWDPNLVISFHKYWDAATPTIFQSWVSLRDQWNMPLWLGESGENSNEWFRDIVRYAEASNIGWSWWPWKKIGAITGPVMVQKPAGYQAILDYWNGSGARPATNAALNALLALAQAARFENCVVHPDVVDALMRPNPQGQTLPYAIQSVPGTVFAANYDLGRWGEAYLDQTTNNSYNNGGLYRNDFVDIEATSDGAPRIGYDVGWLDPGDWMKYTVPAFPAGPFSIAARVASLSGGGQFHLEIAGSNVTGTVNVPTTGGWQSWSTMTPWSFTNSVATNSFRFVVEKGGFNLNWLRLASLLPAAPVNLVAVGTPRQVSLNWSGPSAVTFNVKRASASTGPFVTIAAGLTSTNLNDTSVTNGATYFYSVTAINTYGESVASNLASAMVPLPTISIGAPTSNLVLTWPDTATSVSLRTATSIASPVLWTLVTNPVPLQSTVWSVTMPTTDSARFFRLSTP